jgi:hypothetical protein
MAKIEMLSTFAWYVANGSGEGEFFESCEAAVCTLMERGIARSDIDIDFETRTAKSPARWPAARYVAAYGRNGRGFMPEGELTQDEIPQIDPSGILRRAPRKAHLLPRICPLCGGDISAAASHYGRKNFRKTKPL